MIRLWKGYHSKDLLALIEAAFKSEELLVLCPPFLCDFGFLKHLPAGELGFCGQWAEADRSKAQAWAFKRASDAPEFANKPVLGVFTSGTASGSPRLILYSRQNVEASLGAILGLFEPSRIDSVFCYPQPFHTFGLVLGYVFAAMRGLKLISPEGKYAAAFHEAWLSECGDKTLTLGTPTHFHDLLSHVRTNKVRPRRTYANIMGGAPVSAALWRAARDELMIEAPSIGYGCTEASPGLTHLKPGQPPLTDNEVGTLLEGVHADIVPGEGLAFSGKSLCLAIIQNDELVFPERVVIRDDLYRREDGVLIYRGRTDLVLNRGGQKFSLEKIEGTLKQALGRDVVCVPIPHERLGQDLGVLLKGSDEDVDLLIAAEALRQGFGLKLSLRQCLTVEDFPVNASAKVCRKSGADLIKKHLSGAGCI